MQKSWTDKALEAYLVQLIRALQPKIVVCAGGGEGDVRSAYAASQMEKAVAAAADAAKDPGGAKPHRVQKLYISDAQGQTAVDYGPVYDETLAAYGQVASRQFYKFALPRRGTFTLAFHGGAGQKGWTYWKT